MAISKKTAAAAKSTNKQDVAGRRIKTKGEPQFAKYAEKGVPTRIQEFAEWLTSETGYDVDLRSVYLGSSLRGSFQKSEENQERIAARAAELQELSANREKIAEERAAARAAKAADRAAKAEEAKAAKAAAAKVAAEERAAAKAAKAAAPVKAKAATTKSTKATKAPAKGKAATATTRRRPARASKVEEDF